MKTKVVNIKFEDYDIYIGRPSKWGNPFSWTSTTARYTVKDRQESIEKYREWILNQPELLAEMEK